MMLALLPFCWMIPGAALTDRSDITLAGGLLLALGTAAVITADDVCLGRRRSQPAPRVGDRKILLADETVLGAARQQFREGRRGALSERAVREADQALNSPLRSVTDKALLPPSGNQRDYMSIGIYWWPNPNTPDGLPWVRRDGQVNPDAHAGQVSDSRRLEEMIDDVQTLSIGWHLTGDERYARHAAAMLRTWFLDERTAMNPHLCYAQGVPGRNDGRDYGIITGFRFLFLLDALHLLEASEAWTDADAAAIRDWMRQYLEWLERHPFGKSIRQAENNHGTWYAVQVLWLRAFVDPESLKPEQIRQAFAERIAYFEEDGRQPHELSRTLSLTYSLFNLTAVAAIARLGDYYGLDLWHADPRLRQAYELLARYAA
ncbi:MAG TPA: alginate lyase family protein, partial [Lacipirellulaceae bacterium]|nr:alginate lyase family protein [Lacipirellulaceae bacterium]